MFESLYPVQRGRVERLRELKVPLVIGILIALPLKIFARWDAQLERMGPFAEFAFEWAQWIYFPNLVLVVFDTDFLEGPVGTAAAAAVTIVFYAAIVWWCSYWIEEGYIEGAVTQRLWGIGPFESGWACLYRSSFAGSGTSYTTGGFTR
jgi:hypothetical protein